jgi:hypothetical protein
MGGIMRRRARRRLVVAGAAGAVAYHEHKKATRAEEAYQDQQRATDYAPAPPEHAGPDAADLDQIEKLSDLHASGALTDEEFSAAKAKLLA